VTGFPAWISLGQAVKTRGALAYATAKREAETARTPVKCIVMVD
jgi:hypothetical protein